MKNLPALNLLERIAVAGAIKRKDAEQAKRDLPDGHSERGSFTARFDYLITKGESKAGGIRTKQPDVDLFTLPIICELLGRLGVKPGNLKRSLRSIAKIDPTELADRNDDLQAAFADLSAKLAAELPPITVTTPGRAGSVTSDVSCTVLERRHHPEQP